MRGSSRSAARAAHAAFDDQLVDGTDWGRLAEDLFGVVSIVDGSAALRRALADPSRDGHAKRTLAGSLFEGRISHAALTVVGEAVSSRWAAPRDLTDTLEGLAVEAVLAGAEREGRIDRVEDELFRFDRIVAGDPGLRDVLSSRNTDAAGKAGLVEQLLAGRVAPETARLATQAVRAPRGRRLDTTLSEYLELAARRREETTALVTVAAPLTEQQHERLRTALERMYSTAVTLQVVLDPSVVGGIRVQVGDEVMDGTVVRRLDDARRHMTGT